MSRVRMSTTAGSRSVSCTTLTDSSGPPTSRATTTGVSGARCSSRRSRVLPTCQVRLLRRRVVEHEDQVGRGRGRQPLGDDLPRLEPVGERDGGVVVPERRARPGRRGVRRGHPRHHADRYAGVALLAGDLEHGAGHGEDTGVAGGDDRDPTALAGQVEGELGPLRLHLVVGVVPPLPGAGRHPVDVRRVAHEVVGRGEGAARFGGQPPGSGRPEADDGDRARAG